MAEPAREARGDDGRPDPRLFAALAADDGSPAARSEVLAALATARVFLALSAEALGTEPAGSGLRRESAAPGPAVSGSAAPRPAGSGLRRESAARMSLLSLVSARGARALPAFLGGHEVQLWRPQARPVPVLGPLACRTVLSDGARALLLDPVARRFAVQGAALAELADGRVPVPGAALSTRTAEVALLPAVAVPAEQLTAYASALVGEPVTAAWMLAGPDGPVLAVVTDLPPAAVAALAARVRARLGAALPPGGLDLAVVEAGGPGQPIPLGAVPPTRRFRRPR